MSLLTTWREKLAARKKRRDAIKARKAANEARVAHNNAQLAKARAEVHTAREQVIAHKARPLRVRALQEAEKALARRVMETGGNNRGPAVEEIIHYAGGDTGEPWCVDFVIWCYGHAGSRIVRPGFTRAVAYMRDGGTRATTNPLPGDPVRYTFDHTGIFKAWCNALGLVVPRGMATHILAIEGNTTALGAVSDGNGSDGVYEKVRPRAEVRDFLVVPS